MQVHLRKIPTTPDRDRGSQQQEPWQTRARRVKLAVHSSRSRGGGTEPKNPWIPEIRKNYEKNPNPRPQVAPQKYEKLQKNTKMAEKLPFLYFFGNFFVFSGGDLGSGILYSFRKSFVFPGIQGFLGSVPPPQDRNAWFIVQVARSDPREQTSFVAKQSSKNHVGLCKVVRPLIPAHKLSFLKMGCEVSNSRPSTGTLFDVKFSVLDFEGSTKLLCRMLSDQACAWLWDAKRPISSQLLAQPGQPLSKITGGGGNGGEGQLISRKHPSRDVIFSGQNLL